MTERKFIVRRTEQDDGSYHGGTSYLVVEDTFGLFIWEGQPERATRMTFIEAALCVRLCEIGGGKNPGDDNSVEYSYGFEGADGG